MRGCGTTRPRDKTGFSPELRRKVAEFTPPLSPACVQFDRWGWADGYAKIEQADRLHDEMYRIRPPKAIYRGLFR